jgi:hypothetical protein
MRTWFSFPLGHRFRAGVAVNPNSFITRELPWWECLSDTGTKVWYVGGTAIICGMVWWVIETKGHWNEAWLEMVIALVLARWVLKRIVLGFFPRQYPEEIEADPKAN